MANNDEYNDEYLRRDFLSVSIFGRGYHYRYQNFDFTVSNRHHKTTINGLHYLDVCLLMLN